MRLPGIRIAVALVLFVLIAAAASHPVARQWDRAVTGGLQAAAPAPDIPTSILVFLGDAEVMIPCVLLAGLLLWRRDRHRGVSAVALALGLAGVSVLAVALKHLVPYPGPPDALQRHVFRMGVGVPSPFSFPSGHTMRTVFFAGTALRRTPIAAGALAVGMMAALVYLGDHWTADVLGGLCLSWACVEGARVIGRRWA